MIRVMQLCWWELEGVVTLCQEVGENSHWNMDWARDTVICFRFFFLPLPPSPLSLHPPAAAQ